VGEGIRQAQQGCEATQEVKVFCCLWNGTDLPNYSGGVYDLTWVDRLHRNIQRRLPGGSLTVLVDMFYWDKIVQTYGPAVPYHVIPLLELGIGGWSNVLEIFAPDLRPAEGQRHLAVGLDTVFISDPSWLFQWCAAPVGLPRDPIFTKTVCDAVISFDAEGASIVWDEFQRASDSRMSRYLMMNRPSEMMLLRSLWDKYQWPMLEPEPRQLLSYKCHVQKTGLCPETSVVYFHGRPKMIDLPQTDPIRMEWEGA